MKEITTDRFSQGESYSRDVLTELVRNGARDLLAAALEAEVSSFLEDFQEKMEGGAVRLVRNGFLPLREIQTGIGGIPVQVPRIRDRDANSDQPLKFESSIVPRYLRRVTSVEELIPWLYLRGISTGGFNDALTALLGPNAPGMSPSTVSRLKSKWESEHESWR